jgi:LysR family glycine cleavage system transcriptional activator
MHFTRAAAALGVTVSAASMQIHTLEQYLGLPLFRRHGGVIELTEQGARLLPRIREGLGTLQDAINDARAVRGHGPLRISILASFLTQWLMARLATFEARHPTIDLHIETSTELVDFRKSDVHAAVRFGGGGWPGLYCDKIMNEWLVPVCQPAMLAKLGPVSDHADLKRYRLLHGSTERWSDWLLNGMQEEASLRISIDDSLAIVRAAEAGAGLALARWSLVADDVRLGRLAIASRQITPHNRTYYFVCPPKHREMPKVASFHTWLRAEAAKQTPPDGRLATVG